MTIKPLRTPIRSTDRDGKAVLLVPLANSDKVAKVFPEDYDRLIARGFSPNWCWNVRTVKVSDWKHNTPRVARLIMDVEGPAFHVRHRDGDPLNIRRDNLIVKAVKTRNLTSIGGDEQ